MKRVFIVLLAVVMTFTCVATVTFAVSPSTVLGILDSIKTIIDLGDYASELSNAVSDSVSAEFIARGAQWREYWNRIIIYTGVDEDYFREFWELSYATGGNSAYFDTVPLTDYQIAAYQSFVLIEDTILDGVTLDDICAYCFRDDGVAVDNADTDIDDEGNVTITGSALSDLAEMYQDHYGPKTAKEYISWRTDSRFSSVGDNGLSAPRLSFFTDGYFCGETDWQEVYLVPWYTDGTTDYFGQYQFHFYQELSKDDKGNNVITMYCDIFDMLNGGDIQTITISDKLMDYRYIDFCVSTEANRLMMTPYASYTDYIQRTRRISLVPSFTLTDKVGKNIVYSSDLLLTEDINTYLACWQKAVGVHDEGGCSALHDTGYYCSDKQIYMNFDFIDTSKLTEDDVITLSGDTFYDYTITNSTTGDSTTVYNYITNNYNYPVSEDSSDNTIDSGSVSGDVNVSGNIDVSGSVDVNVNVNTNGSDDGGSMPVDVDLNNYLEQTPEQAKPITEFFSIFFDFLPPELLGLICLGVAVAIILRIWGR